MMQKRIRLEERSKTYIILNQSHATEHINTQKINTAFINGKTKVGENNFQFYFFYENVLDTVLEQKHHHRIIREVRLTILKSKYIYDIKNSLFHRFTGNQHITCFSGLFDSVFVGLYDIEIGHIFSSVTRPVVSIIIA